MIWKFCSYDGHLSPEDIGYQKDEAGNILQRSGAIRTKSCQNCGRRFNVKRDVEELKQNIDVYTCDRCNFVSAVPQDALIHTIKFKDHNLKTKEDSRVVGHRNVLSGTAFIEFKNKDCIIWCEDCHDVNKH